MGMSGQASKGKMMRLIDIIWSGNCENVKIHEDEEKVVLKHKKVPEMQPNGWYTRRKNGDGFWTRLTGFRMQKHWKIGPNSRKMRYIPKMSKSSPGKVFATFCVPNFEFYGLDRKFESNEGGNRKSGGPNCVFRVFADDFLRETRGFLLEIPA